MVLLKAEGRSGTEKKLTVAFMQNNEVSASLGIKALRK